MEFGVGEAPVLANGMVGGVDEGGNVGAGLVRGEEEVGAGEEEEDADDGFSK